MRREKVLPYAGLAFALLVVWAAAWVVLRAVNTPAAAREEKYAGAERSVYFKLEPGQSLRFDLASAAEELRLVTHLELPPGTRYSPERQYVYGFEVSFEHPSGTSTPAALYTRTRQSKAESVEGGFARENAFSLDSDRQLTDAREFLVQVPEAARREPGAVLLRYSGHRGALLVRIYARFDRVKALFVRSEHRRRVEERLEKSTGYPWEKLPWRRQRELFDLQWEALAARGEADRDYRTLTVYRTDFRLPVTDAAEGAKSYLGPGAGVAINLQGPVKANLRLWRDTDFGVHTEHALELRALSADGAEQRWTLKAPTGGDGTTTPIELPAGVHSLQLVNTGDAELRYQLEAPAPSWFVPAEQRAPEQARLSLAPDVERTETFAIGPSCQPMSFEVDGGSELVPIRIDARLLAPGPSTSLRPNGAGSAPPIALGPNDPARPEPVEGPAQPVSLSAVEGQTVGLSGVEGPAQPVSLSAVEGPAPEGVGGSGLVDTGTVTLAMFDGAGVHLGDTVLPLNPEPAPFDAAELAFDLRRNVPCAPPDDAVTAISLDATDRPAAVSTASTGRMFLPSKVRRIELRASRPAALSVFAYLRPNGEPRLGQPYAQVSSPATRWEAAPVDRRNWHALRPSNHVELESEGARLTLLRQVHLEPAGPDDASPPVGNPVAVLPTGAPASLELFEPDPTGAEEPAFSLFSLLAPGRPVRAHFEARTPTRPEVRLHLQSQDGLGHLVEILVDGKVVRRQKLHASRSRALLPPIEPGVREISIRSRAPGLTAALNRAPAPEEHLPPQRSRNVFRLGGGTLRIPVVKPEGASQTLNIVVYTSKPVLEDPPTLEVTIDGGHPQRRAGVLVQRLTRAERSVPLEPTPRPAAQVAGAPASRWYPQTLPVLLADDLKPGTHWVTVRAPAGTPLWARFFIHGTDRGQSGARVWNRRGWEAEDAP